MRPCSSSAATGSSPTRNGHVEEVKGPGVVGEQPVLAPGESFQYTSGWPLKTSTGVMRGTYQMVTEDGAHFDVEIAPFALARTLHGPLSRPRRHAELSDQSNAARPDVRMNDDV